MAIIWQRTSNGSLYEVRRAGRTLRLYRDGVLHTQFNPSRPLTLGVWDLLVMPVFGLRVTPRRGLVLGVGGGAVLRLLQQFFPGLELHGVDLDPVHLSLSKRFFGVDPGKVCLHQGEAKQWLDRLPESERFSFVIDDMFVGRGSQPERVFEADDGWFEVLMKRLEPDGLLVLNFAAMSDLARSAWSGSPGLRRSLPSAVALRMPHYANAVGAFFAESITLPALRAAVMRNATIAREVRSGRFNLALRNLRPRR